MQTLPTPNTELPAIPVIPTGASNVENNEKKAAGNGPQPRPRPRPARAASRPPWPPSRPPTTYHLTNTAYTIVTVTSAGRHHGHSVCLQRAALRRHRDVQRDDHRVAGDKHHHEPVRLHRRGRRADCRQTALVEEPQVTSTGSAATPNCRCDDPRLLLRRPPAVTVTAIASPTLQPHCVRTLHRDGDPADAVDAPGLQLQPDTPQ